jgi:hypothetical protein
MPDLSRALRTCRSWKIRGCGEARASFTAWALRPDGRGSAHVLVRCGKYETIEAMVWRGLAELNRRLLDGMPKPRPEVVARRKLREAPSASRFAN